MTALKCGTVSLVSNLFDYFSAAELLFRTTANSSRPMPLYALDSGCVFFNLNSHCVCLSLTHTAFVCP